MWGLSIFSVLFNFANMDMKVVWIGKQLYMQRKTGWESLTMLVRLSLTSTPDSFFLLEHLGVYSFLKCHVKELCKMFIANKNTQASSRVSVTAEQEWVNEVLARPWAGLEQSQSYGMFWLHLQWGDCGPRLLEMGPWGKNIPSALPTSEKPLWLLFW